MAVVKQIYIFLDGLRINGIQKQSILELSTSIESLNFQNIFKSANIIQSGTKYVPQRHLDMKLYILLYICGIASFFIMFLNIQIFLTTLDFTVPLNVFLESLVSWPKGLSIIFVKKPRFLALKVSQKFFFVIHFVFDYFCTNFSHHFFRGHSKLFLKINVFFLL